MVAEHRAWLQGFLRNLVSEAGVSHSAEVATQLQMLYDPIVVSAQADGVLTSARRARRLAQLALRQEQG